MSELATTLPQDAAAALEKVIIGGDLSVLKPAERVMYYKTVCESVGLNPLTQPFAYLKLSGKLTLYALKGATDQLRAVHGVSIHRLEREQLGDAYMVTAYARDASGREDSDMGVVSLANLKGEALANAMLKAVTKAKRRVTLSICGLGMLDESEVESIPGAQRLEPESGQGSPDSGGNEPEPPQSEPEPEARAAKPLEPWQRWQTPEDAMLWADEWRDPQSGAKLFNAYRHCENAYAKAKREYQNSLAPDDRGNARDFWRYWFEKIEARKRGEEHVIPTHGSQKLPFGGAIEDGLEYGDLKN